jgi:hypothetical protein
MTGKPMLSSTLHFLFVPANAYLILLSELTLTELSFKTRDIQIRSVHKPTKSAIFFP